MKKVLIVDDEKNIRNLIAASLRNEGYDLSEAGSGNEALAKARDLKPDLVILDVMMPDKLGYEVCDEIKECPELKDTLVMFLTAGVSVRSQMAEQLRSGDECMTKPFRPTELVKKVRKLLEQP